MPAFSTPHAPRRIERVGEHAIVVSEPRIDYVAEGLSVQPIWLDRHGGWDPDPVVFPDAFELENRSHAFNFTLDRVGDMDDETFAVFGLPVGMLRRETLREIRYGRYTHLEHTSMPAIAYATLDDDGGLRRMGALFAHPGPETFEECEMSCVDWYGAYRPFFLGDRVFGLLGHELIEAEVERDRVREIQRVAVTRRAVGR